MTRTGARRPTQWMSTCERRSRNCHLLPPTQWDQLLSTPDGVFINRTRAASLRLKAGDPLPSITPPGTRADGAPSWEFQVLGVMPDVPGREP
jgi:hypothetical protein